MSTCDSTIDNEACSRLKYFGTVASMKFSIILVFIISWVNGITVIPESEIHPERCLLPDESPKWRRGFHFNNHELVLGITLTDRPSHWIVSYIFEILVRERLGYHRVNFVTHNWEHPSKSVERLSCKDHKCNKLPQVHVDLEVWFPLGEKPNLTTTVFDHGPLGPIMQWASLSTKSFTNHVRSMKEPHCDFTCPAASDHRRLFDSATSVYETSVSQDNAVTALNCTQYIAYLSRLMSNDLEPTWSSSGQLSSNVTDRLLFLHGKLSKPYFTNDLPNGPPGCEYYTPGAGTMYNLHQNSFGSPHKRRMPRDILSNGITDTDRSTIHKTPTNNVAVHFESHQANKLGSSNLLSSVPLVHQLLAEMVLSQSEYEELIESFFRSQSDTNNNRSVLLHTYFDIACGWVRSNRVRWQQWTHGWDQKRRLLVAGLFSLSGTWVHPGLTEAAQKAIDTVNNDEDYFRDFEYELELDVRNLTCSHDVVMSDFVELLREVCADERNILVGIIAAVCSDSIASVLELAEYRRQLVISPSVESVQLSRSESPYRYFFKTIPSVVPLYPLLSHIFRSFGWSQLSIFRKDGQIFHPPSYGMFLDLKLLIDFKHKEETIAYADVVKNLNITGGNSRIFIVEFFSRGTAVILCAAYHLGMHFENGFVFFLNPWLPVDWWKDESIIPPECSPAELTNMTSFTFTFGHQHILNPSELLNDTQMDYAAYTGDSVVALASALTKLLLRNRSAISAFSSPEVAEELQRIMKNTLLVQYSSNYSDQTSSLNDSIPVDETLTDFTCASFDSLNNEGKDAMPVAPVIRFDLNNERLYDLWVLKQNNVTSTRTIRAYFLGPDRMICINYFAPYWGSRGSPPWDGSDPACMFELISELFGVECSAATSIVAATILLFVVVLLVILYFGYNRRRVEKAKRRLRQPYENLCNELMDIDIPSTDIVINRRVGQGAFGMVYGGEVKCKGIWEAVAVKMIQNSATYEGKTDFLYEAKLMRSLDHKNIVRLIGICLHPKETSLYLIMELMLNGDLKTYLLSRRVIAQQTPDHESINPHRLTQMAIDIGEGVAYMHEKDLVHRDLACRNCLVSEGYVVKIGDFGLTRESVKKDCEGYYRSLHTCELPVRWMSPEAVQFLLFSVSSDLWSYGIVLFEIISFGALPYDGLSEVEVAECVKRGELNILHFLPDAVKNTVVQSIISQCCRYCWRERPSSMTPIIEVLRANPECIRPFLTEGPPKPDSDIDALSFQPGAGACIMAGNAMSTDVPTSGTAVATTSDILSHNSHYRHHSAGASISALGLLRNTIASIPTSSINSFSGVCADHSLVCYSANSFSDKLLHPTNSSAYPLVRANDVLFQFPSRKRHKTADDACGTIIGERAHFTLADTSSPSSDSHTHHVSDVHSYSLEGRSPFDQTQAPDHTSFIHDWRSVGEPSPIRGPVTEGPFNVLHSGFKQIPVSDTPSDFPFSTPPSSYNRFTPECIPLLDKANWSPIHYPALPSTIGTTSTAVQPTSLVSNGFIITQPCFKLPLHMDPNDQQIGPLSFCSRSLSAEQLIMKSPRADATTNTNHCAKSAPSGQLPFSSADVTTARLTPTTPGPVASGSFGWLLTNRVTVSNTGDNAEVHNRSLSSAASHVLRSVLRFITPRSSASKTNIHLRCETLRNARSATSCRAFGSSSGQSISAKNLTERSLVSTSISCPPLLMAQLSTVVGSYADSHGSVSVSSGYPCAYPSLSTYPQLTSGTSTCQTLQTLPVVPISHFSNSSSETEPHSTS